MVNKIKKLVLLVLIIVLHGCSFAPENNFINQMSTDVYVKISDRGFLKVDKNSSTIFKGGLYHDGVNADKHHLALTLVMDNTEYLYFTSWEKFPNVNKLANEGKHKRDYIEYIIKDYNIYIEDFLVLKPIESKPFVGSLMLIK